jgi:ABC-type multidrug transport system ATPase subunit
VAELEEELEIGAFARQRVNRCSSGMIQQLALARSLLGSPALLVLDEPTRSLDDEAVTRLWAALDRRPRLAVLIATHRLDDVDHCDARVQFPT